MAKVIGLNAYAHREYLHTLPDWAFELILKLPITIEHMYTWTVARVFRGFLKKGVFKPPTVALLDYPNFEEQEHPELLMSMKFTIGLLESTITSYKDSDNPFIIHRKELLVDKTHPEEWRWGELTDQEEHAGLLGRRNIGRKKQWETLLKEKGYRIMFGALVSVRG